VFFHEMYVTLVRLKRFALILGQCSGTACLQTLFTRATCKVARVIKWLFYLSMYLSIYRGVTIIYADVMHVIDTFFKTMQRIVKQSPLHGQFLA